MLKFPRMIINNHFDETSMMRYTLKVRYGYAFVRVIRIRRDDLPGNQFYTLSEDRYPMEIYSAYNRPDKSIATENRFKGGDYCGGKINKNR